MTASKILTTLILCGCSVTMKAQDKKIKGTILKHFPEATVMPFKHKALDTIITRKLLNSEEFIQQGRFSHSTAKGDIYLMPYDNMPCLVPNTNKLAPMPGTKKRIGPKNQMPNATPPYRIPEKNE